MSHQGEKIRSMLKCKDYSRIPPAFSIFRNGKGVKKREKPVLSLILFLGMTFKVKGIKYGRQSDLVELCIIAVFGSLSPRAAFGNHVS